MITLPVFEKEEYFLARDLLAAKVATMLGRKMEEGDWDFVYCNAKKIPITPWSNLKVDVNHEGLGVEHKMLRITRTGSILQECGTTKMHPAGTRSIRLDPNGDAQDVMVDVLQQYEELIKVRTQAVLDNTKKETADMRFGWLLWKEHLDEFLYFEEPMVAPDPSRHFAIWNETPARGARKSSKSLWIFDQETKEKVYSVTTNAGVKIQPYFKVPAPNDENLYHFKVQGVKTPEGLIEIWLTRSTAKYLELLLGGLDAEALSKAILSYNHSGKQGEKKDFESPDDIAIPIRITEQAYKKLCSIYENVSDEYLFQQFAVDLGSKK
ncbi:MAG: hypothetical protein CL539_05185 [Alcanivorax sp.]|uniref:hypothetical protein n=1 Tax=Alcanivorax sp. TaxID=1872427 RepID=UPI000C94D98F|nr:hypothetical protein [Alcanivorax sp.]MAC14059.1 hypothetical protein [Alcanivorax sp.]|tara:strand:+ start:2328 stop:3296 length:969 start_codon:yes stop_codon:yes gene_type:complete